MAVRVLKAEFVISNTDPNSCPDPNLPEYAFIGRSNVGKSSLINMITDRRKLAKISGRPGKTQLINHFKIESEAEGNKHSWYLVDLPGYGFAKASKTDKAKWEKFIRRYILTRKNLLTVFVLLDSRHPPQGIDLEFMEWLGLSGIPFVRVFTKTDKLSKVVLNKNLQKYEEELEKHWAELPERFITSAISKDGQEDILNFVMDTNPVFYGAE